MSSTAENQKVPALRALRWLCSSVVDLACLLGRRWPIALTVLGLYGVAWHFLFVNLSPSLPYTLVWLERGRLPQRGELMVYRCCAHSDGLTPANLLLFKKVAGTAGDQIKIRGRAVYVNQLFIGLAKEKASNGQTLMPILPETFGNAESASIPPGFYFAQGLTNDSFDSRYRQSGLVAQSAILGVAHPIF
jgi:conjugal transfer pilin signal peptidase TrbI